MNIQSFFKCNLRSAILLSLTYVAIGCGGTTDDTDDNPVDNPIDDGGSPGDDTVTLHDAFAEFDTDNVSIYLDGTNVVIESNGLPNHTSPYWSSIERGARGREITENHPLYVEPTVTSLERMVPGNIDDFVGMYTLTVPANPSRADSSTATSLGPIGIAVSGSNIYNDEEGQNRPLDNAIGGLDYVGAHTGPSSYHYHLEPVAISHDDENLVGIMADGFFIYGRRDFETGTYPDDLDASGGHVGLTSYSDVPEYHYHIVNELYIEADSRSYVLFAGDYQGTPNAIQ